MLVEKPVEFRFELTDLAPPRSVLIDERDQPRKWCAPAAVDGIDTGKVYLAVVVVDVWSWRVVGGSIADHIRAELVADDALCG